MANRIASLLGNTKTRTMVLLVLSILIVGVVLAVSQTGTSNSGNPATQRVSRTTSVPQQVKSTPGSDVTRKYQELQQQSNERGAQLAAKKGTTFFPTVTGNAQGFNQQDFQNQLSAAFDDLGGKCTKEKVAELKKQGMTTTQVIMQLKGYGCSAAALAALFTPEELAAALDANCVVASTSKCGADAAKQLMTQGQTATQVTTALKNNGCSFSDIASALKQNNVSINDIAKALKDNGADATQVANALVKAGFNKADILPALTQAGFSPIDIAKALSSLEGTGAVLLAQQQPGAADAQRLNAQQEAQQLAAYSQQRQGKVQDLMTAMQTQQKAAMDAWTTVPQQNMVVGEWAAKKAAEEKEAAKNGGGRNGKGGSGSSAQDGQIILKAGSILFAVLDTAVNSDEPGPITATIVSGSLKGSKLMGTMNVNTNADTISINFSAINMPDQQKSMGINAVAIDPDTARTALASDVDHHYLYRWGSLFASSFVQGYASAIASSGTTSVQQTGLTGTSTTTSTAQLSPKQQLFSGLSAVGTKWSSVVGQNFNTPDTITIDQGTGIGVLLTSDMTYGQPAKFYDPANPLPDTTAANAPNNASAALTGQPSNAATGALTDAQKGALLSILQNQTTAPAVPTGGTTTVTQGPNGTTITNTGGTP